jgi:hypothetical protein
VERYVIRGGRDGYARLQVLARARRADTVELLHRAGLRPGMLRGTAESLVSAGLASAEEVAAAIEDLAAFTAAPDTVASGARIFQVWARR